MKKATFKYSNNPTGRRQETIFGTVTLKNDGKLSTSLHNGDHFSSAARYQAKLLAKEIAAADFKHEAVTNFVCDDEGLVGIITERTQELRVWFIEKTKEGAKAYWKYAVRKLAQTQEQWYDDYGVKTKIIKDFLGKESAVPEHYNRNYYAMQNKKDELRKLIDGGFAKFEETEVKHAELHYKDCVSKLSYRLGKKGVKSANEIEITSGHVGVNLEVTIKHGDQITKAWTIIAEGPVQTAHYRYLVK